MKSDCEKTACAAGVHAHGHACAVCEQDEHRPILGEHGKLIRACAALAPLALALFVFKSAEPCLCAAAFLIAGADVVYAAVRNLLRGEWLDENFLMALAAVGAFAIGEYAEAAAVVVLFQAGEYFQDRAVDASRRKIASLMDVRPDTARRVTDAGETLVAPDALNIGDEIEIRPGERVPADAEVTSGGSWIDTSALSGESRPSEAVPGAHILAGCVNIGGVIRARVEKPYGESAVSRVLALVEEAADKKAKSERFITRFARWYTPAVVAAAALLAALPPLLTGAAFSLWLGRALVFLVVSCPCALVISVPLTFFAGIGGAAARGILVKGGNHMEALAHANTFIFDKTGTLTEGAFYVRDVAPRGFSREELLFYAAHAEYYAAHPVAAAIRAAYGAELLRGVVADARDVPGKGVCARVEGRAVCAGSLAFIRENAPDAAPEKDGAAVYVSIDGAYAGRISVADRTKKGAADAIGCLRADGARHIVMMTGDDAQAAETTARELGIDDVRARLLPADKVAEAEKLMRVPGARTVFIGDGVNDAPLLARADVGVAMGALGSDAAIEAADVVVMTDEVLKVAEAVELSRRTLRIVNQNVVFALAVKFAVLALGALGIANMWLAVFADVGVAILATLNALRARAGGGRRAGS